jgi:Mn-dependent DtxR family transcriptional regulator
MAKSPPPSASADRTKEYLEQIESYCKSDKGYATRFDISRKSMNNSQSDRMINYFLKDHLIEEFNAGYRLTKKGVQFLEILRKHRELVGILTQELSGRRIKPYY